MIMCVNLDNFISHAMKVYGAMPRNNALLVCNLYSSGIIIALALHFQRVVLNAY